MIGPADLLMLLRGKTIKRFRVRVRPGTPAVTLAAMTLIRNEARYLAEWIDFHVAQGVSHFYVFDNGSTDATADVLAPYVAADRASVIPWPHRRGYHTQALAYAHALKAFGPACRWMAFFDVDEFLYCPDGRPLTELLARFADYPALIVHRHTFGTSGHLTPPPHVVGHFPMRVPAPDGPFRMQSFLSPKSIVQPSRVAAVNGAHTFILKGTDHVGHDESGAVLDSRNAPAFRDSRVRIDHFYTRDRQTFMARAARGLTAANMTVSDSRWQELLASVEDRAVVHDDSILRVLPPDWPYRREAGQTAALRERPSSVSSAP